MKLNYITESTWGDLFVSTTLLEMIHPVPSSFWTWACPQHTPTTITKENPQGKSTHRAYKKEQNKGFFYTTCWQWHFPFPTNNIHKSSFCQETHIKEGTRWLEHFSSLLLGEEKLLFCVPYKDNSVIAYLVIHSFINVSMYISKYM